MFILTIGQVPSGACVSVLQLAQLQAEVVAKQDIMGTLCDQLSTAQQQLADLDTSSVVALDALQAQLAEAAAAKEALQAQAAEAAAARDTLQAQLAEAQQQLQQQDVELAGTTADDLAGQLASTQAQLAGVAAAKQQLESQLAQVQQRLEDVEAELAQVQQQAQQQQLGAVEPGSPPSPFTRESRSDSGTPAASRMELSRQVRRGWQGQAGRRAQGRMERGRGVQHSTGKVYSRDCMLHICHL